MTHALAHIGALPNLYNLHITHSRYQRLLKIMETGRNHEFLMTTKNLQELDGNPFPYIIPVVPRSLPAEVIEGEHFVLTDLLKLISRNSS